MEEWKVHRGAVRGDNTSRVISPERVVARIAALEQERDRLRKAATQAHHDHCSCGGSGPKDPGACGACLMWHKLQALAGGEAE